MKPFDFQANTKIVFGAGRLRELGQLSRDLNATRAMVVSDPGIVAAGHTGQALAALQEQGIETALFDRVHENPSTLDVDHALDFAKSFQPDLLIGLGGGSSMDCAKGLNFLLSCGGRMQDYWGVGKATGPMLPTIAVPTTAGTGSEAQSFALISDAETHVKMACGDKRAACRVALLDPKLTLTQPPRITALTGIDAVAHAVETYVTKRRNPMSRAYSLESWRLLATHFPRVLEDPLDLDARSGMQLGACFAGMAIENSMLGAAHALANPLTAAFGAVHGEAVGVMLPHVVRFNGRRHDAWYAELLHVTSGVPGAPDAAGGADALADFLTKLTGRAGLAVKLTDMGISIDGIDQLAADAAKQWTGTFNPVDMHVEDFAGLYRQAV